MLSAKSEIFFQVQVIRLITLRESSLESCLSHAILQL